MCDGVGLVADEVVEAVCRVCVNEAVSNPFTGADTETLAWEIFLREWYSRLVDVGNDFESRLDTIFLYGAVLDSRKILVL